MAELGLPPDNRPTVPGVTKHATHLGGPRAPVAIVALQGSIDKPLPDTNTRGIKLRDAS